MFSCFIATSPCSFHEAAFLYNMRFERGGNMDQFMKHLQDIEKHLDKNEKWLQYPEKKMGAFEIDFNEWNRSFLEQMGKIIEAFHGLEKHFGD